MMNPCIDRPNLKLQISATWQHLTHCSGTCYLSNSKSLEIKFCKLQILFLWYWTSVKLKVLKHSNEPYNTNCKWNISGSHLNSFRILQYSAKSLSVMLSANLKSRSFPSTDNNQATPIRSNEMKTVLPACLVAVSWIQLKNLLLGWQWPRFICVWHFLKEKLSTQSLVSEHKQDVTT